MSCVECWLVKLLRSWSLESCRGDGALSMCVCIKLTLCWSWRHLDFRSASPSVSFCNCAVRNAVSPSPPTPTLLTLTSSTHLLSSPFVCASPLPRSPSLRQQSCWKHYPFFFNLALLSHCLPALYLCSLSSPLFLSPSACFPLHDLTFLTLCLLLPFLLHEVHDSFWTQIKQF